MNTPSSSDPRRHREPLPIATAWNRIKEFYTDSLGYVAKEPKGKDPLQVFKKRVDTLLTRDWYDELPSSEQYKIMHKFAVSLRSIADPSAKASPSSLTSMLGRMTPNVLNTVLESRDRELQSLLRLPYIKSVSGMQAGRGIPELKELSELVSYCKQGNITLSAISRYQIGIPDKKDWDAMVAGIYEKKE